MRESKRKSGKRACPWLRGGNPFRFCVSKKRNNLLGDVQANLARHARVDGCMRMDVLAAAAALGALGLLRSLKAGGRLGSCGSDSLGSHLSCSSGGISIAQGRGLLGLELGHLLGRGAHALQVRAEQLARQLLVAFEPRHRVSPARLEVEVL